MIMIATPLMIKCFFPFIFQEVTSWKKGSLHTLHVGHFKRHGSSHTRRINRQTRFDKETDENR